MELTRVVVTGLGAITPLGNDPKTYWENLIQGVSVQRRLLDSTLPISRRSLRVKSKDLTRKNLFIAEMHVGWTYLRSTL